MKPALTIRIETDPVAASAGVSNAPLASAAPEERISDRRVMAFILGPRADMKAKRLGCARRDLFRPQGLALTSVGPASGRSCDERSPRRPSGDHSVEGDP